MDRRLGREIWRSIRLVVDTGIHAKGWSAFNDLVGAGPLPLPVLETRVSRWIAGRQRA